MATNPFRQELQRRQGTEQGTGQANPFRQELQRRQQPEPQPEPTRESIYPNPRSAAMQRFSGGEGAAEDARGVVQGASELGASFTGGVFDVIGFPVDLLNIPLQATGLPTMPGGGQDLRQMGAEYGMTFEPGQDPDGFAHRAARIAGSTAVPLGGIMGRGSQLLRTGQQTGPLGRIATGAASRPGTTVAVEGVATGTAAGGGEIAGAVFPEGVGPLDLTSVEAIGEVIGGLTPAAVLSGPAVSVARRSGRAVARGAFPFTRAGGEVRASRRLQEAAADPEQAATRVEGEELLPEARLSPARRTGDKRLLAIERAVAREDPELDARLAEELSETTRIAREAATDLGGDQARVRLLLEGRRDYLVNLVNERARIAGEKAQEAIQRLGTDTTPRETSRVARERLEAALTDAQATENRLWGAMDRDAPASLENSRRALQEELAGRSRFEDPEDIPKWLENALTGEAGPVTFGDVHALRKRVGTLIGKERAEAAPNRNKVRILSNLYESLLEDMGTAQGQGEALESALAYSRQLNQKFRQGAVGRLLGYERRGGLAVSPEDTMRRVISGEAKGTQVRQLLEAAPEAQPQVEEYLRSAYLLQTMEDGRFNQRAARTFLNKYDEVLEQFPGLREQLTDAREMNRLADRLGLRAERVGQIAYNQKKSRAALYLEAPIGEEMNRLLRARDPAATAKALRRKMGSDTRARQGLKSAFVEELLNRSRTGQVDEAGEVFLSGNRFRKLLNDYDDVANALGMTSGERTRLRKVANTLSRVEARPGDPEKIMEDMPSSILDLAARLVGAKSGQRIAGQGMGSSLVLAQAFSQRMRNTLQRLTRDKAHQLIAASIEDPNLFRTLLTGPTASPGKQRQAAQRLNAWLAAPAAEQAQEQPQ